jgi:hypothetical protein
MGFFSLIQQSRSEKKRLGADGYMFYLLVAPSKRKNAKA